MHPSQTPVKEQATGAATGAPSPARRPEFLPFSRPTIGPEEAAGVLECLETGWITTGPKVSRFEEAVARLTGSPHAVAIASGTAGLHLTLLALGIGQGDEVITPSMTFVSTLNMIVLAGATPVLVDVDPATLNLDTGALAAKVGPRTKAIIPVHFAGLPCDLDAVHAAAEGRPITVIEDAAHAIGSAYKGRPIGGLSPVSIFSFHPIKNITTGEGGIVTTPDGELADKLRLLRFHGMDKDAWRRYDARGKATYDVVVPGFKYNMMDLQAAIGLAQLEKLTRFNARRAQLAALYDALLEDEDLLERPGRASYEHTHSWHLYVVKLRTERLTIDRDEVAARLKERENIGTGVHFKAAHQMAAHAHRFHLPDGALRWTDWASDRILSLPLYPSMTEDDVRAVVSALGRVLDDARSKGPSKGDAR